MIAPLELGRGVTIPSDALEARAVRSSGPGGQNVNKVSSKVELRVDLSRIVGLDVAARVRLLHAVRNRLDADGRLLLTSQVARDRIRNQEDVVRRLREIVVAAMIVPLKRRATRPSRGAVERRIDEKKRRGATKTDRRSRDD